MEKQYGRKGDFMDYIERELSEKKTIALVAHDNMKKSLIDWVDTNKTVLEKHRLVGTGTTAILINGTTGLDIEALKSGPLGGDQQLGARIAEEEIDVLIFFWDPLEAQPHDPDVKALLRIAVLYDIPIANNRSTADFILSSEFINKEYNRKIVKFDIKERINKINKE